ncbi:Transposase InsO and inactivated derivatives [Fodinibius roseus]|uniref:Transposase InsO and inactivated derivatives n=1 Tax=Fodinibius roseus TaxID=1194090 RepID=A0A1M4UMW5_9BACT|nr:IS3 family transposase [Fodinibius roseus]SHE58132.1 Transposase InsO and inactivated derivatives [Fodinibius roseus]
MDEYNGQFSIVKMSQTLGVSHSGYYRWRGRGPSKRALENKEFTQQIRRIWEASAKTYGSPRIHHQLLADGETLSRPRVARLMKKAGIASQIRPKWAATTDSGHALPVAPNLLERNFEAEQLAKAWVSDITYLPSSGGWLYLTTIMDLAYRQIIGWSLAESMATEATTVPAWNQACSRRRPAEGLLFHSDRGIQYAAADFTGALQTYKVTQSMSRKGNCWDIAPAESFFKTLKAELPADTSGCSYSQVRRVLFNYIEIWYNHKRLHSSLDYQTPAQTEQNLTQQPETA